MEMTGQIPPHVSVKLAWEIVRNLALLTAGSVMCALGVNGILMPREFVSGGITGAALVVYYLTEMMPVGVLYFLLNIPLFVLGWKFVGRRFFIYSLIGMIIFSAAIEWIHLSMPVQDNLLGALLAGILIGVGSGIILRSSGSAGGTDILSVILMKKYSIRLGSTILIFNGTILLVAAIFFSLESALYTLIYLYVSSNIVNVVVTGLSQRKAVMIISQAWRSISTAIMAEMNRGVTVIPARGGYTGAPGEVLYTVITFRELSVLKRLITRFDPDAFFVVTDTLEVMGRRIGNQPHW
ncbi:MAG: YitT family protein [Deltaproteobacteria bacterium]|nr:YitT family protein [Deltaproteobacteria bacterium]MBN2686919.1 YitT family protein [Deltaproteobacteria bacterium]